MLSVWQSIYAKEPIDGTVDGPAGLGVAFELVVTTEDKSDVGVEVELDERIKGLLLEDETMVCRVVTEDVEMVEEELFTAMLFVV